jgi:AcrR family transcriptional regulator
MVALRTDGGFPTKTRQQLLEAAGEVFAEYGYRAATVREICLRAGANVASIHYHFGDKEKLYLAVLRYAHEREAQTNPELLEKVAHASPEERLRQLIRSLLLQLLDPASFTWDAKILVREMVEPTMAMDVVVAERIRPLSKHVREIVAAVMGGSPSEDQIREAEFSVVSQCVFYHHCRAVVSRLYPKYKMSRADIDKLVEHITAFSVAGLKAKGRRK